MLSQKLQSIVRNTRRRGAFGSAYRDQPFNQLGGSERSTRMAEFAIWKRLDAPGHDAAQLRQGQDGEYILEGMTVFRHESEPACLAYRVDLAPDWSTTEEA